MTFNELRRKFNNEFALGEWPTTYELDAKTYANVCQYIFDNKGETSFIEIGKDKLIEIAIGPNNGIMFKNVELIYKPV
jgi:hypothetical protein